MRSKTAKMLAGGEKITKVQTWDAIGQPDGAETKVRRSWSILVASTGLYHEDGDINEDGYRLSEVLDTDMVLAIHTAAGRVWSAGVQTHLDALTTGVKADGSTVMRCQNCRSTKEVTRQDGEKMCAECLAARREDD